MINTLLEIEHYEFLVMRMFSYQITKTNECQKMHSNNHEEEQIMNPNNINFEWYSCQRQNKIPMNHVFRLIARSFYILIYLLQEIIV